MFNLHLFSKLFNYVGHAFLLNQYYSKKAYLESNIYDGAFLRKKLSVESI